MQKKLLSLAIAGALALPGAAMADLKNVDVYGKFHASWDMVDNESDFDDNTGAFRNARLGFKGSEKLNNSFKAIWQIETDLDTNSGQDKLGLRNTFIGLQGDKWGTFAFGKHDTPYKMATAKLDIFSDTIADYNNIIGVHVINSATGATGADFNTRASQAVMYNTPNFGGFEGAIARISAPNDEAATKDDQAAWSAMAKYDKGPLFASLAYELYRGGAHPTSATSTITNEVGAWKLGFGYELGESKASFVYEDIEQNGANNNAGSRSAFNINFAHDFGANTVKVAYARANDSDAVGSNDGADNWSLGLDHNFSKRTKIYGIYTRMGNDSGANYGLYGAQADGGTYYTGASAGKDVSAFSFGIIHDF
uniref:Outer membrane protein (Porin) n=1 Tax=Candidatus Kentrum sp. MB TaxID=2138164 RepID=A0A450XB84_9GAMM|nr:MAG: Outer membrane protein (porin) [Candidatus Kentron sp. MB]VFK74574.1 MAG: Outer membrane protein (porin) [Candidatus Kentron sp. MB]